MKESKAFEWLIENGPTTNAAFPHEHAYTVTLRQHGVRRLCPRRSNTSKLTAPRATYVYYHPDHHSDVEVIRAFFEANPEWLDASYIAISGAFDSRWNDALNIVLTEEYDIQHHAKCNNPEPE